MMDWQLGQPDNFAWLWLVAALAALSAAGLWWKQRAVRRFATPNRVPHLIGNPSWIRQSASLLTLLLGLTALVGALVDVRWGRQWQEVPQRGLEVVFALDVSRSMLAEDVAPNRLEKAKQGIRDMLEAMPGDRVGLVIFSGDVRQQIPLTSHYDDFRRELVAVGPDDLNRGGSNLAQALSVAADSFLSKTGDHRAIVLITDGENHGDDPAEVARELRENSDIRVFPIGLGDVAGARIPVVDRIGNRTWLEHDGAPVQTRLEEPVLREIAAAGDGVYIPAGTRRVDMGDVYRRFVAPGLSETEFEDARINAYIPRYQWFLGAGLLFLCLHAALAGLAARTPRHATPRLFDGLYQGTASK